jgi:diadenosine tetraphosphatase ApaH/serine/threonine PP2A family protein phosphatase
MRVAVISDIHGNLAALERTLESVRAEEPDKIWCLGDTVGYGPEPNECCALVAAESDITLVGNHDLGVLGELDLSTFSTEAAAAAEWTQTILDDASRSFLASLPPAINTERAALAHGSPRDPIWEYVLSWEQAAAAFESSPRGLILVGHSHAALHFSEPEAGEWGLAPEGTTVTLDRSRLLNPGSVGQPRDGDPRAAWLLVDFSASTASFRRTSYDIPKAQAAIIEAGLPDALAERLAAGV